MIPYLMLLTGLVALAAYAKVKSSPVAPINDD